MAAKLILLALWILPFMPRVQPEEVNIGVFVDSGRDVAGPDLRPRLKEMGDTLAPKATPNTVKFTGADTDWDVAAAQDDIKNLQVAVTALHCDEDMENQDYQLRKGNPNIVHVALLKESCPRPRMDHGVGFPVLTGTSSFVPILVDLRVQELQGWDNVIIIHDSTTDLNQLEGAVEVFMSPVYVPRTSTVVTFMSCDSPSCSDPNALPMKKILQPLGDVDDNRYFIIVGTGNLFSTLIAATTDLGMMTIERKFLFISTESSVENSVWDTIRATPEKSNMAVIYKESSSQECAPTTECVLDVVMNTLIEAVAKVTSNDKMKIKNEIINNMKNVLENSKNCGGCLEYVIQSSYLEKPRTYSKIQRSGTWSPYRGLKIFDGNYLFPVSSGDFRGRFIKIGIMLIKPEVTRNPTTNQLEGLTVKLVEELSRKMNFSYDFVETLDKEYGNKVNGKEWGGLMKMLLNGEVEFVANGMYITKDRAEAVNFTTALDEEPYLMFIRMPQQDYTYLFLAPFTWDTWICITITVFLMGPLLNIVHRLSKYYEYYDMNDGKGLYLLSNCAWYCFGAVVQQGGIHLPWSISGRVLVGFWWIFVIVTVTSYSGNLVAVLTFPKLRNPIDTIDGLISYRRSIKWAAFNGEAIVEYLENARSGPLMTLGRSLRRYNRDEFESLLPRVRRNKQVIFMSEREVLTKIEDKLKDEQTCNYAYSNEPIIREPIALPVPKGWPYIDRMNKEIKKLVESGLVMKWKKQYWPQENACTTKSKPQAGDTRKISLEHMWGSFFVLFFGFGSAVVSLLVETVYRKYYLTPSGRLSAQVRDSTMRKDGMAFQGTGGVTGGVAAIYPTQSKVNLLYDADADIPEQFTYNLPRDADKYPSGSDSGRNKKRRF